MLFGNNARRELVNLVERIERVAEEIATGKEDMKEIFEEAKSAGFDKATIRRVIRIRALTPEQRERISEQEALVSTYLDALGEPDGDDSVS